MAIVEEIEKTAGAVLLAMIEEEGFSNPECVIDNMMKAYFIDESDRSEFLTSARELLLRYPDRESLAGYIQQCFPLADRISILALVWQALVVDEEATPFDVKEVGEFRRQLGLTVDDEYSALRLVRAAFGGRLGG